MRNSQQERSIFAQRLLHTLVFVVGRQHAQTDPEVGTQFHQYRSWEDLRRRLVEQRSTEDESERHDSSPSRRRR